MATSQAPSAPEKVSVWEDFVDIFVSPSEVFTRRMGAGIWLPLILLTVVAAVLFIATKGLMQPVFDAEWSRGVARAMAKNPSLTAAQMEQGRAIAEKFIIVAFVLGIPISIAFTGLMLWLVGKIFGAVQTLGNAMMVATYAWCPRVLAFVAAVVIALVMDPSKLNSMFSATLSVGHFFDPDATARPLLMLLGRIDVFIIWQTALLGIGLAVTGKIPRAQGYLAAAFVWLIGGACMVVLNR
jgi:hypothetical protein